MDFKLYSDWLDYFLKPITIHESNKTILSSQALITYELNASFVNGKKLLTYIKVTSESLKISFNAIDFSGIAHYFFGKEFDSNNEGMFKTSSKVSESTNKLLDLSERIIKFTDNLRAGRTDYSLPEHYKF